VAHHDDDARLESTHNTARFFTEQRHISWVLLVGTLLWGLYGYVQMPKRKDPAIPVTLGAAVCAWPGASAERIEELVTRRLEEKIAENSKIKKIESISRNSVSIVLLELEEDVEDTGREYDDIRLRLDSIRDLPQGAGPIELIKDFGDTAALLLTVATPPASPVEVAVRARDVRRAIEESRAGAAEPAGRATFVLCFPEGVNPRIPGRQRDVLASHVVETGAGRDPRPIEGPGFVGLDLATALDEAALAERFADALRRRLHASEFHPDVWRPVVVGDPAQAEKHLQAAAGDKYSYGDLDRYTEFIKRSLQTLPQVSKIFRAGVLQEQVYLEYSQERLAGQSVQLTRLMETLAARNIVLPGGVLQLEGKNVSIDPTGEFRSEREIGDVIVTASERGTPTYLRDLVDITRGYTHPPVYLNFLSTKNEDGTWRRSRALSLAIQMRPGRQIGDFGREVDRKLEEIRHQLPEDLILDRTSDQPLQVEENISLFMKSLYEAIVLVVLVALVGFWEWRSALVMALAIPLTLAMTFGMMHILGIDLQQVSIASLIIALGLLVDDPVVAGDAIKRALQEGKPRSVAAWLGPTRLANAILFATITNIVAYLPMLMVSGQTGLFVYSLPVVLACSLVASRIVSMTFIPLLGYYLLRPSTKEEPPIEELRRRGFTGFYYKVAGWALDHRLAAFLLSLGFLGMGALSFLGIKTQFFPKDLSYLSYVDVWLPEDATLTATDAAAREVEQVIREVAEEYGRAHGGSESRPRPVLRSLSSYVGGGAPRFWFSISPELVQPNYAQVLINLYDKHDTGPLVEPLQRALTARVAGARVDVRQLETGKPVGIPVSVRLSGDDIVVLRRLAGEMADILRAQPGAERVRDDWGADSFSVRLNVDPDRANFAGVSNLDVALSSAAGVNGVRVTTLREGDRQIPVVARLRAEERAQLSDLQNLYVYALKGEAKVPLRQVSSVDYQMTTEKVKRRNQFRTVTVSAFPAADALPSEVMGSARAALAAFAARLPVGYRMEIGGEEEEQVRGFKELSVVMLVSVAAIFLALVFQFRSAVKPLIVFSAIPYGMVGALLALVVMQSPFGFMAFLGVASLVGVIVSHVIVLFDFIEEAHAEGMPLRDALLDAGIVRLRPVLITVGATVFGLVPLALHGGPLWEPLCYTQIGGLTLATVVTLVLVPVLYAIFVLDLKLVKWDKEPGAQA
jgi:multidrug efflux pump subunit AcrB